MKFFLGSKKIYWNLVCTPLQVNPVRMKTDQSRIIDVAASHYTQISAALTETSKVFSHRYDYI